MGRWAFLAVVVVSVGGPLTLGAVMVPTLLTDVSGSTGLVVVLGSVVFTLPVIVWARYSRRVAGGSGLAGFVEAAAGRPAALTQAVLWTISYVLYLVYTTTAIVYFTLPAVLPGVAPYRPVLQILIPVALAVVMLAGRAVTLAVIAVLAVGQFVLLAILAGIAIGHDAPAASFTTSGPAGSVATATGLTALLYVCASLPVFLGGEVRDAKRTVPRALLVGYALTALGVVAVVFPLAANPAFLHAPIPGVSIVEVLAGRPLAIAVGIGVAASTAGVMLVEYLAVGRLVHAYTGRSLRSINVVLAVILVGTAPITLINPGRIYADLLTPSMAALWLSQLIVVAVYPRFARRHGLRVLPAWALAICSAAIMGYGFYTTVTGKSG